tara:strand:+ start:143 stop:715 length:573 start_codon:yes stop_codon:yes gene_type:complete
MKNIIKNLKESNKINRNFYSFNPKGYWSNLNKDENKNFIQDIKKIGTKRAVKNLRKDFLYDVIFSKKRGRGINLLNLKGNEIAVDFGCMWGALTIPLAKKVKEVLAIDQTINSLFFLFQRAKENKLKNISLLQENLRKINLKKSSIDIAIVNGVLEWIGETNQVVVDKYLNRREKKKMIIQILEKFKKNF